MTNPSNEAIQGALERIAPLTQELSVFYQKLSKVAEAARGSKDPLVAFWRVESVYASLQSVTITGIHQGVGSPEEVVTVCQDVAGHSLMLAIMAEISFKMLKEKGFTILDELAQCAQKIKKEADLIALTVYLKEALPN